MAAGTMRAVRWHARRDVRVEQVPQAPAPGPGQVRATVACCGLCGTDVHEYLHGPFQVPLERHPVTGRQAPMILGHEVSAHVESVGAGVGGVRVGDLVALNAVIPCGRCGLCRRGDGHLCPTVGHIGMSADGGLADLITVPADMVVPAPAGMDPAVVALAEPFAVSWHALRRVEGVPRARTAVVGAGTIGLCLAMLLREAGTDVVLVDVDAQRLAHAAALGFPAVSAADGATHRGTYDLVVECSGALPAAGQALALTARGGTLLIVGLPEVPVTFDVTDLALREVRMIGSVSHLAQQDMVPAIGHLARHAGEAARLVTARIALEDTVRSGFDVLAGPDRGRHAKIMVEVAGGH